MKIKCIGNYYSNNAGDDIYMYLLRKFFGQHEFFGHKEKIDQDYTIYGGGGILDGDSRRIRLIKKPFCVLSVGCLKKNYVKDHLEIFRDADFITVRDKKAYDLLKEKNNRTYLVPDFAFLYKPDTLVKTDNFTAIMLRHLKPGNKINDEQLVDIFFNDYFNPEKKYLLFHVYGQLLEKWTLNNKIKKVFDIIHARYEEVELHNTTNLIQHLNNYNRCTEIIGMPLHSIILAMCYGIAEIKIPYRYDLKMDILDYKYDLPVVKHLELLRGVL